MKRTIAAVLAGTACAALAATTFLPGNAGATSRAPDALGLTLSGRLVEFAVDDPRDVSSVGAVHGLSGDQSLVGMDFRPADGKLYGLGDAGGIYTLNTRTAAATKTGQLTVALDGTRFGVDFNPAADRLRVVSDTGQNLRHDVNANGTTIADTPLNTPPATTPTTGITAAAYTNNDNDATTGTALFDISPGTGSVVLQVPANAGTLTPQGPLGVVVSSRVGFDIASNVKADRAVTNTAYAALGVHDRRALYTVDLLSGHADRIGYFPRNAWVIDIAVELDD